MSRHDFRGRVEAPRPTSAWIMVGVASLTLWVTGQLEPWVIAIQLLAYGTSYATRELPKRWQHSPIWLNIGMAAITAVTIRQALLGNPAAISLAYFSALTQALQLLDARPRKSEFLLVALALFQVILASNLTDSVLFPPLVFIFLFSVTWTLLVHTLRTEAVEAQDPAAASRAITPGLLRVTCIATGFSVVLALVVFMMLPRLQTNGRTSGFGMASAVAGFSDSVRLGTIGRIRADDRIVLRVEAVEGELPSPMEAYWRGLAFDHFDGESWSISAPPRKGIRRVVSGIPRFGVNLHGKPQPGDHVQRIVREPVEGGVVFGAGRIDRIEGPFQRLESDWNGGLYLTGKADDRVRYRVWTYPQNWTEEKLRLDQAKAPFEVARGGPRRATRYHDIPDFDPRIGELAKRIVSAETTDADRARAIERMLRREGRYTDNPKDFGTSDALTPIEDFLLGDQAGHCEYFASAMVVLSRSVGLPARLVNGFAGGRVNSLGGFVELTSSDAHAWVEIHYEEAGWVRYDPTPPDLRMRRDSEATLLGTLADLSGAIELWWFQRVVDFDSADQIGALRGLWLALRELGSTDEAGKTAVLSGGASKDRAKSESAWEELEISIALIPLGGIAIWLVLRRRRDQEADRVPESYRRALRLLGKRGAVRRPAESARAFAEGFSGRLPEAASDAFRDLTEAYLHARFSDPAANVNVGSAQLDVLRDALQGIRRI